MAGGRIELDDLVVARCRDAGKSRERDDRNDVRDGQDRAAARRQGAEYAWRLVDRPLAGTALVVGIGAETVAEAGDEDVAGRGIAGHAQMAGGETREQHLKGDQIGRRHGNQRPQTCSRSPETRHGFYPHPINS
jgi:hypothetical protein